MEKISLGCRFVSVSECENLPESRKLLPDMLCRVCSEKEIRRQKSVLLVDRATGRKPGQKGAAVGTRLGNTELEHAGLMLRFWFSGDIERELTEIY